MAQIIYAVEYDKSVNQEGDIQTNSKELDKEYSNEFSGEARKVTAIMQEFSYGNRTVIINFDNGESEEIFDINRIFRKYQTI